MEGSSMEGMESANWSSTLNNNTDNNSSNNKIITGNESNSDALVLEPSLADSDSSLVNNELELKEVSKYDVLLVRKDGKCGEHEGSVEAAGFEFFLNLANAGSDSPHHVGNNRCAVFCKMNLAGFSAAATVAAQNAVLDAVYDIVGNRCFDVACQRAGKFLQLKPEYQNDRDRVGDVCQDATCWNELTRCQARDFLRDCLEKEQGEAAAIQYVPPTAAAEDDEKKRRRRSSLLRRSLSSGNVFDEQKKRVAHRKSIFLQVQKFDASVNNDEDDDDQEDEPGEEDDDDAGTAVDSISVSESVSLHETRPPLLQRTGGSSAAHSACRPLLERSPSWSQGIEKSNVVHTAYALDVILQAKSSTSYTLVPNHTGNNRILVMVQLRLPRYLEVTENSEKAYNVSSAVRQICGELVDAVQANYSGRFLVEHEQDDDSQECYLLLTDEQAAAALVSVFQSEAAAEERTTGTNISADEGALPTARSAKGEQRPSFIKEQTLQQLHQLPSTLAAHASNGDVHKAALESLQKRKQRQGVNSKISQMVAINSVRERSRSVGDVLAPVPTTVGQLGRFASTGGPIASSAQEVAIIGPARRQAHGNYYYHPQQLSHDDPAGATAADFGRQQQQAGCFAPTATAAAPPIYEWNELQPTDLGLGNNPLQHQFQQEQGISRRRSTLSEFSQGMIHDMLLRLESNNSFHSGSGHGDGYPASGRSSSSGGNNEPVAVVAKAHLGATAPLTVDDGADSAFPVSAEAAAAAIALGLGRLDPSS